MDRDGPVATNRRPWGFTLLEICIVLAIMAIVAAIAAPRYGNAVARYQAEVAARRIVADLSFARDRARASGANQVVIFSPDMNEYQIPGVVDLKDSSPNYTVRLSGDPYNAQLVSADFEGSNSVIFNGYDVPSSGGAVVVKTPLLYKTVVIDQDTGRAKVQ
ncbi:MAG: GspH/FimT family protein [Phycisphaerae bacterium]|nr:GspH/FimT family protein [Phycisphaerae bacterium]